MDYTKQYIQLYLLTNGGKTATPVGEENELGTTYPDQELAAYVSANGYSLLSQDSGSTSGAYWSASGEIVRLEFRVRDEQTTELPA